MPKIAKKEREVFGKSPRLPKNKREVFGKSSQAPISSTSLEIAPEIPRNPKVRLKQRLERVTVDPPQKYPLQIERLPDALQWWDEVRYWLIHQESRLRVPGSFTKKEAQHIREISKDWNWSVGGDRRVACGIQLMALAESLCKRGGKS